MLKRDRYLNNVLKYLDTEFVKVITGVRRAGKSFLLLMLKKHLKLQNKQILYLNFENPNTFDMHTSEKLYEYIKLNIDKSKKAYFLFDEIGEVENWQKLINGLRVAFDCDIYITGSNANILSGELATYLSGRYVEIKVYPLSLEELALFSNNNNYDLVLDQRQIWGISFRSFSS